MQSFSTKNYVTRPLFIFTLIFTTCILWSCSTTQQAFRNNYNDWNSKVLILPAYANIQVIETGNKLKRSKSASEESATEISAQERKYIPSSVQAKYVEPDAKLLEEIANSGMMKTIREINSVHNRSKISVPKILLKILDSLKEDYGLFIYQVGIMRTFENLKNKYYLRKVIGVPSFGVYNSSCSVMIGILIDNKKQKVIKYKELYLDNRDPNERFVISFQVRQLIESCFQTSN